MQRQRLRRPYRWRQWSRSLFLYLSALSFSALFLSLSLPLSSLPVWMMRSVVEEVNRWQKGESSLHANDRKSYTKGYVKCILYTRTLHSTSINETANERTQTHSYSLTLAKPTNEPTHNEKANTTFSQLFHKEQENWSQLIEGVAIATHPIPIFMCECYAWGFPYQLRITNALTPKAIVHLLHLTWWLHKMLCIKRCQPITNNWRSSINAIRNFLRRFEEFLPLSWDTLFFA